MHAEIVYLDTPEGGAVFSVGSITFCGSLWRNGFEGPVSQLLYNVVKRFEGKWRGLWAPGFRKRSCSRTRRECVTEPCDLSATEARALIGAKQLSPVELTRKLHPPHRGGRSRRQRDGGARFRRRARGGPRRRAAGDARRRARGAARPAARRQGPDRRRRACRRPMAARSSRTTIADAGRGRGGGAARGRRHRARQDQHAGMGRGRQHPQRRLRRDRQSVRPDTSAPARPADRRRRWPAAWCRSRPAPIPAARCRNPAAFCGVVGLRPTPG